MNYFLGLDAGGTKTGAAIIDESSQIVAESIGGSGNYHNSGIENVSVNVHRVIEAVLSKSFLTIEKISRVTIGFAACDTPKDYTKLFKACTSGNLHYLKGKLTVVNDTKIGLYCGTIPPGIVVICGTGSNIYGINDHGEEAMAGNWGHFLGDKGSGFQLAKRMFQSIVEAYDGSGPETNLTQKVEKRLGIATAVDLIDWENETKPTVHEIADFAPLIIESAESGDEVARDLLDKTVKDLGRPLVAVVRRLKMEDESLRIVTIGGLFESKYFRALFEGHVTALFKHVRLIKPLVTPAVGAAIMAKGK